MKKSLVILSLLSSLSTLASAEFIRSETCQLPANNEPVVYANDFSWKMTLEDVDNKFKDIYNSGKRLTDRAYLKDGVAVLPYPTSKDKNAVIKLSDRFIISVAKQVEEAFALGYVDALIFPDMGHSHLFIPLKEYEILRKTPNNERNLFYEKVFDLEGLKTLYHTSEQVLMVDDNKKLLPGKKLQWRYYTRNLIGSNNMKGQLEIVKNLEHTHNTAHDYKEGYYYYGAGYNISASKDGCFGFKKDGKIMYFDISMKDLPYKSDGNDWGYKSSIKSLINIHDKHYDD
jgi:hypothetical protein